MIQTSPSKPSGHAIPSPVCHTKWEKSEPFYTIIHHPGTSAQGQPWASIKDMTGFPLLDEGAFICHITDPIDESRAGASDDASLPSLPTWKQQINFENTANQQDISSTKSPDSSNVIYMGQSLQPKIFPNPSNCTNAFGTSKSHHPMPSPTKVRA